MIVKTISANIFAVFLTVAAQADTGHPMKGIASVYAYEGEITANGETAKPSGFTAAHKSLPFGTLVKVTNLDTGKSVVVRINDRGPFVKVRVIDLTREPPPRSARRGSRPLNLQS